MVITQRTILARHLIFAARCTYVATHAIAAHMTSAATEMPFFFVASTDSTIRRC